MIVLVVGVWAIATAPIGLGDDGLARYESLDAFLRHGTLDRSKYSFYGPLASTPLWYLGEALGNNAPVVCMFNRMVFLIALAGLWETLRPVLPLEERIRFVVLLIFGTMFTWHVIGFYAETFHVACVGVGLALLVTRGGGWAVLGAALCAYGTANVPASAVGLALAACVLCWHFRRFRYLALPAAAAVLILLENAVRRGDPLTGGYAGEFGHRTVLPYSARPGFSYPLFFGLLSVFFSFGKGLVFFVPGLFARYPEGTGPGAADARRLYHVWLAVVVGLVLVYARWWSWYGGAVWGPRFFLFASLPASLVLARWTARPEEHSTPANVLVLAAVALSCWVGANGLVFHGEGCDRFWANNFEFEYLNWYVPEDSVLWMPFVYPLPIGPPDYARLAAFAGAFAYLAWPVGRVLAVRGWHALGRVRAELRTGPRWRF
jgi:hypothetical protein